MKESFEEIVNILENRYKSFMNDEIFEEENIIIFGFNLNIESNIFFKIDINKKLFHLHKPTIFHDYIIYCYFESDYTVIKYKDTNSADLIAKIDANLKTYHNMQKQLLKNKINNL